jgi:hypothetical protein
LAGTAGAITGGFEIIQQIYQPETSPIIADIIGAGAEKFFQDYLDGESKPSDYKVREMENRNIY